MRTPLLKLRPFEGADLPKLLDIRHRAIETVFRSFREIIGDAIAAHAFARAAVEQPELLASICNAGSGHHVIIMRVGDALAGFASYKLDSEAKARRAWPQWN